MNDKNVSPNTQTVDPKIQQDWDEIEARRADISSRDGGDTRRQAILKRLSMLEHAS
jgi:hypothetical protein